MRRKNIMRRRVSAPGCDDAPVVSVERGDEPKWVTLVYPYYENPQMLAYQIGHWVSLPRYLREQIAVIVVDDGSPYPADMVMKSAVRKISIRCFRIEVDVRWNWIAARNLGMSQAEGWCLLTDMDHMVPRETIESCVYGHHDPNIVYRFSRRKHSGGYIHPHPNSWFMTREMFWQIGGYDEALSGHYGTDGEYRRRVAKTAPVRILTDPLVRHEFMLDASTTRYKRKQPEDRAVSRIIASRHWEWQPQTLSFPWHEVAL